MNRTRSKLVVELDLDPVPGWGHTPEDHRSFLQTTLDSAVGHYHPTVTLVEPDQVCIPDFGQDPHDCSKHGHVLGGPPAVMTMTTPPPAPPSFCGNPLCLCHRGGVS